MTVKFLIEKSVEYNMSLILVFVDFHEAFDTIELNSILEALQVCHLDYWHSNLIHSISKNATIIIKLHETTNQIRIERSVGQ